MTQAKNRFSQVAIAGPGCGRTMRQDWRACRGRARALQGAAHSPPESTRHTDLWVLPTQSRAGIPGETAVRAPAGLPRPTPRLPTDAVAANVGVRCLRSFSRMQRDAQRDSGYFHSGRSYELLVATLNPDVRWAIDEPDGNRTNNLQHITPPNAAS